MNLSPAWVFHRTSIHPARDAGRGDPRAATRLARRDEWAAGRSLAARALRDLGAVAHTIGAHDDGAPAWPAGVHGSIAHADGVIAVLASADPRLTGLGVDVERVQVLGAELRAQLCAPGEEREFGRALGDGWRDDPAAHTLLFAAKEAAFKAHRPRGGTPLAAMRIVSLAHRSRRSGDFAFVRTGEITAPGHGVWVANGRRIWTAAWMT